MQVHQVYISLAISDMADASKRIAQLVTGHLELDEATVLGTIELAQKALDRAKEFLSHVPIKEKS